MTCLDLILLGVSDSVKPGTSTACQTTCKQSVRRGSRHQDKVTFTILLHDTQNSEDTLQRQNYIRQKTSPAAGNTQTASLSMPTTTFPTAFHVLVTGKVRSTGVSLCLIPIKELECFSSDKDHHLQAEKSCEQNCSNCGEDEYVLTLRAGTPHHS